jgi:hypothetical protein
MRYPFQTFIATVFVFTFMGLVIASGELKIGNSDIILPQLSKITVKCVDGKAPLKQIAKEDLAKICTLECSINAAELMKIADKTDAHLEKKSCLKEIKIKYSCNNQLKTAYFYTGQQAKLSCNEAG